MNKLRISFMLSLFSVLVFAHSGDDPLKDLAKNRSRLATVQNSFEQLTSDPDRFESLEHQANYLLKNIMILRNLMAKEYPRVKARTSKYKIDYMKELDNSLKEFRRTLKQMKATMPDK